jgi:hypothetical protein
LMSLYVDTTYIHMSHEAPFLMLIVRYMCFTHSCLSAVSFSIYGCDSPTYASKPAAPGGSRTYVVHKLREGEEAVSQCSTTKLQPIDTAPSF